MKKSHFRQSGDNIQKWFFGYCAVLKKPYIFG